MNIIADTNIWYGLGQEEKLFEKIKSEKICPTFPNIHELSKSENLIDKEELSRSAIRMLFKFKENVIYEPPFIHLAKLNQEYEYDVEKEIGHWLNFTSKFAKGHSIEPNKADEFRQKINSTRKKLTGISNTFNKNAEKIRQGILNKKIHKQIDTYESTAGFLDYFVKKSTNGLCNFGEFEMIESELLLKTLDHFFTTLEISTMKVQANDWYDFAILAYVQPGDKYWTREKRWIKLIKEAGCEKYLYVE